MISFAEEALGDLERTFDFNIQRDPRAAIDHLKRIRSAILVLEQHPQIGRRIDSKTRLRELVISYGKSGYVALYEHSLITGSIRVVAIRHQSEAGYRGE